MGATHWFDNELLKLEEDIDFLTEEMAFDFVNEIRRVMKEQHISQTDLATRMGKSRAYISKVLNYNPNMTIRSLAIVAKSLGLRWTRPHLVEKDAIARLDIVLTSSREFTMQTVVTSPTTAETKANSFNEDEYHPIAQRGHPDGKQQLANAA